MTKDNKVLEEKPSDLDGLLEATRKEAGYYRKIAEDSGKRRIREIDRLSKLIADHKRTEKELREANEILEKIYSTTHFCVVVLDRDCNYLRVNQAYADASACESQFFEGKNHLDLYPNSENEAVLHDVLKSGKAFTAYATPFEIPAFPERGITYWDWTLHPIKNTKGDVEGLILTSLDVTEIKRAEMELKKHHAHLEELVKKRTVEVEKANRFLNEEIEERKLVEKELREKEKKLEHQTKNLEEVNTALKVLLDHREEEKKKLGEDMLMNVKKMVLPYLDKLDKDGIGYEMKTYINIIKSNLEDLISPFANRLSSKYLNLTPSEIQVADFIKHGKTSKEIAALLNVSYHAVVFHRNSLRRKLDLANKKINLRSYLHSLAK